MDISAASPHDETITRCLKSGYHHARGEMDHARGEMDHARGEMGMFAYEIAKRRGGSTPGSMSSPAKRSCVSPTTPRPAPSMRCLFKFAEKIDWSPVCGLIRRTRIDYTP